MTAPSGTRPRASRLQTRLWFFSRLHPELPFFTIPVVLRLSGELDERGLRACLTALMDRHRTLRTLHVPGDDGPELVLDDAPLVLAVTDLSGSPDPRARWERVLADEYARPLDIERGPLLRAHLARLGPGDHMLAVLVHHICVDGPSIEVMLTELSTLYAAWEAGEPLDSALDPAPESYEAFSRRLDEMSASPDHQLSRAFWRDELGGRPAFDPPTDRPRQARRTFEVHEDRLDLPAQLADEVREFARLQRVTPFVVLSAALTVLLGRRSGPLDDVVIATPWSLRTGPWLRGTVGFFINTVPLRVRMTAGSTFQQVLKSTRGSFFDAMDHCAVPFDEIVALTNPARDLSRLPITSVCFQVLGAEETAFTLGSLGARRSFESDGASDFDLVWDVIDPGTGPMTVCAKYTSDTYDAVSIRQMQEDYARVLRGALTAPRGRVVDIPLYDEPVRARLLELAADAGRGVPRPRAAGLPAEGPLYLLDDALRLTGFGSVGEVYVDAGGDAAGELVADPVTGRLGHFLRRTGLRARLRPDGGWQWCREPRDGGDEVADALLTHPLVTAAATAQHHGELVAYVATDHDLTPVSLREYLLERIAPALIPAWFVLLDELPLDPAGGVDAEALDEIARLTGIGAAGAQAGSELEETVRAVWQECLGTAVNSLDVSFFAVDGHSLIAARIAARLQRILERTVPVRAIFETPTIRLLAAWLDETRPDTAAPAEAVSGGSADLATHLGAASEEELAALLKLTGMSTAKDQT